MSHAVWSAAWWGQATTIAIILALWALWIWRTARRIASDERRDEMRDAMRHASLEAMREERQRAHEIRRVAARRRIVSYTGSYPRVRASDEEQAV